MARLPGKSSSINLGGAAVVGVNRWNLNARSNAIETTGMDSAGVQTYIAGLSGWAGGCNGHWDTTETKLVGATPALKPGTSVATSLLLSATVGNLFSGTSIITGWTVESSVDTTVSFAIEYQGTGALTYPTA